MGERGKKGKKKGKPKVFNLKQGPYSLRDGDVIAVKVWIMIIKLSIFENNKYSWEMGWNKHVSIRFTYLP